MAKTKQPRKAAFSQPVALASLHEDPNNARLHDERNLAAIEGSLLQFGQVEPLVVQRSTGKVIGGNGRLKVMFKLGWTEAEVVYVDVDDTARTALGVALNRTAELADWDNSVLNKMLADLMTGQPELDAMLAELARESNPVLDEEPAADQSDLLNEKFQVLVECETEAQQGILLERLTTEGLKCRSLIC